MSNSSSEIKGAIIGTLLGDSWISNRNEYGCEQISENLILKKKEIIDRISPEIHTYIHSRQRKPTDFNKNPKRTYILQTNKHPYFEKLRNLLYINGSKQVTINILNKLTPEGIALWLMDDGYLDYKKSSNTRNIRICTDSFDEFSIKQIKQYFSDTHNIQTKVMMHIARKGYLPKPRISFGAKEMQKLILLVYKYFLPEFFYKINLHYLDSTLNSKRCSHEYREAAYYILQHIPKEDIV